MQHPQQRIKLESGAQASWFHPNFQGLTPVQFLLWNAQGNDFLLSIALELQLGNIRTH